MKHQVNFKAYGESAILIEWPSQISDIILSEILVTKEKLVDYYAKQKVYINHSYNSILIDYIHESIDLNTEITSLKLVFQRLGNSLKSKVKLWEIPVCYEEQYALDLQEIAKNKELSTETIISKHTEAIYKVYFLGFLPGFLYLGGIDEALWTPRRSSPRLKVPKGAVAIGGSQTGIYPNESPGGWHIIGQSPVTLFNSSNKTPSPINAGDSLCFKAITALEYQEIAQKISESNYQLKYTLLDD
ncbi:MAG: 5-oxoprolinase subunit PxpB [bacterium]